MRPQEKAMKRKRRNHLPGFKARVALAAIKGDKTLAELSEQFDVHQNQIQDWKKQLLEQADSVFGSSQERKNMDEAHLKELHAKIGELTLENDFLAKALGR
jgi:transposase-like protein